MKIFDYTSFSADEIRKNFCISPTIIEQSQDFAIEQLIGKNQNICFEVFRMTIARSTVVKKDERLYIYIVLQGSGMLEVDGERHSFVKSSRFLIASSAKQVTIITDTPDDTIILVCCPDKTQA